MLNRLRLSCHDDWFHLGMPILAMLGISIICGLSILSRPGASPAEIRVWIYGPEHGRTYASILPTFQEQTSLSVRVDLLSQRELNTRLLSVFMSGSESGDLPDLVELEVDDVAKYLRPPADQVGLLPLDGYLAQLRVCRTDRPGPAGALGSPGATLRDSADVHPVTLTYRKDLWDEAGIDPQWVSEGGTRRQASWPQFQQKCLDFQQSWGARGAKDRHAIELFASQPAMLAVLLRRRHINIIDGQGHLHLNETKTAATLSFYAQLVAGRRQIAGEASAGVEAWAADVSRKSLLISLARLACVGPPSRGTAVGRQAAHDAAASNAT